MSEKATPQRGQGQEPVEVNPGHDLRIDSVAENNSSGGEKSLTLTPEERELVASAIQASFGRQENDSGQLEPDIEYILDQMATLSEDDALEILQKAVQDHDNDPNFPDHTLELIKRLLGGPKACDLDFETYAWTVRTNAALIYFHSPYAEVRAISDPFDDTTASPHLAL